jgi:hypothetical protein
MRGLLRKTSGKDPAISLRKEGEEENKQARSER